MVARSLPMKEEFVRQLLLYDQVLIPTNDFAIVPILLNWVGASSVELLLREEALRFVRPSALFGFGAKGGLVLYSIQKGERGDEGWEPWQSSK